MKAVSLEILSQYENQYIALSEDRAKIIASGKTIKNLENKLEEMKIKNAVIEFVEPLISFKVLFLAACRESVIPAKAGI